MEQSVPSMARAKRADCPFCDSNNWVLTRAILGLRVLSVRDKRRRYLRTVAFTCEECGFVRLQHPASMNGQSEAEREVEAIVESLPSES